ncbi:hypothetical protein DIPPA_02774 [Diplonema papillatum]|nr:hypothetical protein DIPPA_02774 [Diplonema papillatum]
MQGQRFWRLNASAGPDPRPGSDGRVPEGLRQQLKAALEESEGHFFAKKTPEGTEWTVERTEPFTLLAARHKKTAARRYRLETVVEDASLESLMGVLSTQDRKPAWMSSVAWVRYLRRYDLFNHWVDVEAYTTKQKDSSSCPQLFVDGRMTKIERSLTGEVESATVVICGLRRQAEYAKTVGLTEVERRMKDSVFRISHSTTMAIQLRKIEGSNATRMVLLVHMDLGGWLPAPVVNVATPANIVAAVEALVYEARTNASAAVHWSSSLPTTPSHSASSADDDRDELDSFAGSTSPRGGLPRALTLDPTEQRCILARRKSARPQMIRASSVYPRTWTA